MPDGSGAYDIHQPDHWAFAGTGLSAGERLGVGSFIVGYEVFVEPDSDGRAMGRAHRRRT